MASISTKLTYKPGKLDFSADIGKRWGDEPLTKTLGVSGDVPSNLFPHHDEKMCITAYDDETPVGYVATNKWNDFIKGVETNLKVMKEKYSNDAKVLKFLEVVEAAVKFEKGNFRLKTEEETSKIAHSCGLLVLESHSNKGVGTELYRRREKLIREQGFDAVVVETTNKFSAGAAKKNGFKKMNWSYDYKEHGIELDDEYGVWIKWF